MPADLVSLERSDFERLSRFTGLTYVLLEQLEAVLPLIDANCEQRATTERAIAIARKALNGDATPTANRG